MAAELHKAVEAVAAALDMLGNTPNSVTVTGALDQAAAAVAVLDSDATAAVLQRLVVAIEHCHRAGPARSPQLDAARRRATVVLQNDPRWV